MHQPRAYWKGLHGDFNHDDLIDLALSSRDKNSISVLLKKNMVNPLPEKPQG
jgi:hypothetical protein